MEPDLTDVSASKPSNSSPGAQPAAEPKPFQDGGEIVFGEQPKAPAPEASDDMPKGVETVKAKHETSPPIPPVMPASDSTSIPVEVKVADPAPLSDLGAAKPVDINAVPTPLPPEALPPLTPPSIAESTLDTTPPTPPKSNAPPTPFVPEFAPPPSPGLSQPPFVSEAPQFDMASAPPPPPPPPLPPLDPNSLPPMASPPEPFNPGPLIPQRVEPGFNELPDNFIAPDFPDDSESGGVGKWLAMAGGFVVIAAVAGFGIWYFLNRPEPVDQAALTAGQDAALEEVVNMDSLLKGGLNRQLVSITSGDITQGQVDEAVERMEVFVRQVNDQHKEIVESEAVSDQAVSDELQSYQDSVQKYDEYADSFIASYRSSAVPMASCYVTVNDISNISDADALKQRVDDCTTKLGEVGELSDPDFEIVRSNIVAVAEPLKVYIDEVTAAGEDQAAVQAAVEKLSPILANFNTAISDINPSKTELIDLQTSVINLHAAISTVRDNIIQNS